MAEWEHFCYFVLPLKAAADSYRAGGGEIQLPRGRWGDTKNQLFFIGEICFEAVTFAGGC
ncbi:hypothetical protein [uncultured Ruminococcus sp.]|uniref:hypothetical protein n=1 Tax=uncultured Ruminococcus sp. TaxID=165186 RepID=UPI0025CDA0A0|nr:hypothetical protein [uncultured Ruminococcus sp.]